MSQVNIFDSQTALPDLSLTTKQKTLLGFENRFSKVRDRLRLLLNLSELAAWSNKNHGVKLALCDLVSEQYPLIIFHGDVGTGKSATAECIANQLVIESKTEDSILFKLSNRVRGSGKVGEMGTLLTQAFHEITQSIGKNRRAILVIDEGDSLAAARSQEHSHHEDKVAVNTLIQCIDDLRRFNGRIVVFLCTNRISILDPAIQRRAGIVEEFQRPGNEERRALFNMDLADLAFSESQIETLVQATGAHNQQPSWTYSDIRTRLYPTALAMAFPDRPLKFENFQEAATTLLPSPIMENH
jgi:SpoVK/Ycf46/Vps4 family AAA+-type ATPase